MKKHLVFLAAACAVLAACQKEEAAVVETVAPAKVELKIGSKASKALVADTANEAKVNSIQAFVFNGNSLDAYDYASAAEIEAQAMEVSCSQGKRDIWVIVNAPSLASVTTLSALKASVTSLLTDNAADSFVMIGKAEGETVTETYAKTIYVDRNVSRVRLFQIKRDMTSEALKDVEFKIVRAYITDAIDNSCIDVYTPTEPEAYVWKSAYFANSGAMETGSAFLYKKLESAVSLANGATNGTAYADNVAADWNFYVYPNKNTGKDTASPATFDQTKLVVECYINGSYYTYPIPLGAVSYNKTYDVKLLTITKLGNNSNGDDVVDEGEDDVITAATATFTVTVNDWEQVLTFGGVTDGNITI